MSIPKWRYVRYTDDGSSLYQCLSCYNDWDARTAPGWDNPYADVPEPCEGSHTLLSGPEQTPRHYIELDVPVYHKTWTFCPYCGVEWEGPLRLEKDNEYMYGPKRLAKWRAVQERRSKDGWRQIEYTGLWWVIQRRTYFRDEGVMDWDTWETREYAKVGRMPAAKMHYLLGEARKETAAESDVSFLCEAQLVTTYVEPQGGYEICNYDWPLDSERPVCYTI